MCRVPISPPSTLTDANYAKATAFSSLIPSDGYQEGVYIGGYDGAVVSSILSSRPYSKIHVIDLWGLLSSEDNSATIAHTSEQWNSIFADCCQSLSPYRRRFSIIQAESDRASRQFLDGELDYVFIDGSKVFASYFNDIIKWMPKLFGGGVIAGAGLSGRKSRDVELALLKYFGEMPNIDSDSGIWWSRK